MENNAYEEKIMEMEMKNHDDDSNRNRTWCAIW